MGVQLKNPPVYFVIGQVRFNEQLGLIRDHLSLIQERFRRLGYSDFRHQELHQVDIVVEANEVTSNTGKKVDIFDFAQVDRNELFRLEGNQLSLHTVNYRTFKTFSESFAKALAILADHAQIEIVERVGLRFLNAVMCPEGQEVDGFLHKELWGYPTLMDGLAFEYGGTEALLRKDEDSVLARVVFQRDRKGRVVFPVDLSNTGLQMAERFQNYEGQLAILDSDAYWLGRKTTNEFIVADVVDTFARLKKLIDDVFYKSATQRALSFWGGEA